MKKSLFLFILMAIAVPTFAVRPAAPEVDQTPYIEGVLEGLGVYGALNLEGAIIGEDTGLMANSLIAIQFKQRKLSVGIGFSFLIPTVELPEYATEYSTTADLAMSFGGVYVGTTTARDKKTNLDLGIFMGLGALDKLTAEDFTNDFATYDFGIITPKASLNFSLTKFLKLTVDMSYRKVFAIDSFGDDFYGIPREDLSGFNVGIGVKAYLL